MIPSPRPMQPKRDPSDRRYWPLRSGGVGQGFLPAGQTKERHRYQYGTISKDGAITQRVRETHSMDQTQRKGLRQAVRDHARLTALKLLDRISLAAEGMDAAEAATALGNVGKLADTVKPQQAQGVTLNIGMLHLDALRARHTVASLPTSDSDMPEIAGKQRAQATLATPQATVIETVEAEVVPEQTWPNAK